MMKMMKNNFIAYSFYTLEIITILSLGAMFLARIPVAQAADGYNVVSYSAYAAPEAQNPVPTIHAITPTTATTNSGSQTMTVTGTNFVPGSVVRINGTDRATTFVSSTNLTAELNHSDTIALGTHTVHVFNRGPGGGLSNSTYLNIKQAGTVSGASTKKVSASKTVAKNPFAFQPATESDFTNGHDYSGITANAVMGSNSFLPSGLMQWILFAILILLIVIIARKLFGKDKYAQSPLKHA